MLDRPSSSPTPSALKPPEPARRGLWKALGPGLITGAADDDPSGIGTYSQAGAGFGYAISWTMLLTFPLMLAIQEISARLGRVTGHGIAGNVCRHYSRTLTLGLVTLLFFANVINIGANLGAMADSLKAVGGGSAIIYVLGFGIAVILAEIFLPYQRYVTVLKWLTLSLFSYIATLAVVEVEWGQAIKSLLVPTIEWRSEYVMMIVAILGTTISPYLFFWQASQEAEDQRVDENKSPLLEKPRDAAPEFRRIRLDTMVGMAFSNLIAIAIIFTTAATLHASGNTEIESSVDAAKALEPIAGQLASLLFAAGIIGTGLLSIPVLAGSAAYGIGEAMRRPVGFSRKPRRAVTFYAIIALSTTVGIALNFFPVSPIAALYWSAVINGVLAAPVMIILMLMTRRKEVMGKFTIIGPLATLGWAATGVMMLCDVALLLQMTL